MPRGRAGDDHGGVGRPIQRQEGLGFRLGHGRLLDRLPLAVETVELGRGAPGRDGIRLEQQPRAERRIADAPAGIDARPEQIAEVPAFGRGAKRRDVGEGGESGPLPAAHDLQALADEGAVEPDQGDDVGDGRERDEIEPGEKVGRRPRVPEAALAQGAVQRHQGEKDNAGGAEMAEARQIVLPVRVDEGGSRRQALGGLVVVEHDRVEAEPRRFGERLVARRAAIDRDEQARALRRRGRGSPRHWGRSLR